MWVTGITGMPRYNAPAHGIDQKGYCKNLIYLSAHAEGN